jgi:hypothetical protein
MSRSFKAPARTSASPTKRVGRTPGARPASTSRKVGNCGGLCPLSIVRLTEGASGAFHE